MYCIECNLGNINISNPQFVDKFNGLCDKIIPIIKKCVYAKMSKPMISFSLLESINRKNKLYKLR